MDARRQRDPARGAERAFTDHEHREQQHHRGDIERINARHQRVIIDLRHDPHQQEAGRDKQDLLPPRALPNGIVRRAEDLQHAQGADRQHDEEHRPVEIFRIPLTRNMD